MHWEDALAFLGCTVIVILVLALLVFPAGDGCGINRTTRAFHSEIAACNKQKMSWNRLEIRENNRGFVRCIDHRTNQTKLVPVTY